MNLDGVHHVTAITADAQASVDFAVGVLGLRLVKTTVNFDAPDMYHLYFGDETGSPGSILTFFEIPGSAPGRPGAGMIHRILWRVGSPSALDHWERRLADAGRPVERGEGRLISSDPEGLGLVLVPDGPDDGAPRTARSQVPPEHAIRGILGVRAYAAGRRDRTADLLTGGLGFTAAGEGRWETRGAPRPGHNLLEPAPPERPEPGAGTVHHRARSTPHHHPQAGGRRIAEAGARPTQIIDRQYFHSIYFREPGGVLFEIATPSPGFAVDEKPEHLGEALRLPPQYEQYRARIEEILTPLATGVRS
jgi:glyoxalase family protein